MFSKFKFREHISLLSLLAKIVDIILYLAAALLAFYLQFHHLQLTFIYKVAILIACLLLNPIFSSCGVYLSLRGRSFFSYMRALIVGFVTLVVSLAAIAFITKTGEMFSRSWFLLWNLSAFALLTFFRIGLRALLNTMRQKGLNQKHVIVIGSFDAAKEIIDHLKNYLWSGYNIQSVFCSDENITRKLSNVNVAKIPADLSEYVTSNNIDEVWIVINSLDYKKTQNIIGSLNANVITIRFFPLIIDDALLNHSVTEIMGLPVINIVSSPMMGMNRLIKAIEDRVLAVLILLLISPVFLLLAILVKLSSPGPIFYRQKRVGWNGKEFEMYKFRSMLKDAENSTGAIWATVNDKRPTKIGTFLRRTSLDELPQFINVLKGEMSIVGPRPERPIFVEKFKHEIPAYMQKHLVKAGITGWAQINGWRGNTDLQQRIECDIYYINHWSLWFDLKIIFLTLFKGFINKNAY